MQKPKMEIVTGAERNELLAHQGDSDMPKLYMPSLTRVTPEVIGPIYVEYEQLRAWRTNKAIS
jgi:hypothetical protein